MTAELQRRIQGHKYETSITGKWKPDAVSMVIRIKGRQTYTAVSGKLRTKMKLETSPTKVVSILLPKKEVLLRK